MQFIQSDTAVQLGANGASEANVAAKAQPLRSAPELSIIVPTYNERDNLPVLVDQLRTALKEIDWELIFVDDDSSDGTVDVARSIGARDARIRCIRRVGRRGLSGACLEGILASQASFTAVMDGDLQHDEKLLGPMLVALRGGDVDLVIGTRLARGGAEPGMSATRLWISRFATRIAQPLIGHHITDPMSGFFMIKRSIIETNARRLSTQGFKVLLDIVMTAGNTLKVAELPYQFGSRQLGQSKLDARVVLDFLGLIIAKLTNDALSTRFVFFTIVGLVGIVVHFAALAFTFEVLGLMFTWSQSVATVIAIASNFVLNNAFTYSDQRLVGWRFVTGLLRFYVVAAVGAAANIGVGNWIFSNENTWWVAGLAGGILGVVWNYLAASVFVWRIR